MTRIVLFVLALLLLAVPVVTAQESIPLVEVVYTGLFTPDADGAKAREYVTGYCGGGRVMVLPGTRGLVISVGDRPRTLAVSWEAAIFISDGFPCPWTHDSTVPIAELRYGRGFRRVGE